MSEENGTGISPYFDFEAAVGSKGSPIPQTGFGFSGIKQCAFELEITGPNNGTRFLCVAFLHLNPLSKHYKACQGISSCPVGAYEPIVKPARIV